MMVPEQRITVYFNDGTESDPMVIDWIRVEDGIVYFGRDSSQFLAAPIASIKYWK